MKWNKFDRYQELITEIKRISNISSIKAIPVVAGALGSTLNLKNCTELGIVVSPPLQQKTALPGKACILQVLDSV